MILNYIKTNPTENMTIFILDPLPRSVHATVAKKILNYGSLFAEQVGFLEPPTHADAGIRLQMMGGEFCGNATRALAALAVHRAYPCVEKLSDNNFKVIVEVSSVNTPLPCSVLPLGPNQYSVSAEMPLFQSIQSLEFAFNGQSYKGIEVCFPGITHLVIDADASEINSAFIETVKSILPIPCEDALGIMLYNSKTNFLTPVVYTQEVDTIVWERGCGSGTAAVIAAIAYSQKQSVSLNIAQPGGILNAKAEWLKGSISKIEIEGPVIIVSDGTVNI